MHDIKAAAGQVIANDTQNSVEAVDNAVLSLAHLCASIVEVSKASRLPVFTAQTALANVGEGLAKMISTRNDVGQATRELRKIQKASNLETVGFGCPPDYQPSAKLVDGKPASQAA